MRGASLRFLCLMVEASRASSIRDDETESKDQNVISTFVERPIVARHISLTFEDSKAVELSENVQFLRVIVQIDGNWKVVIENGSSRGAQCSKTDA